MFDMLTHHNMLTHRNARANASECSHITICSHIRVKYSYVQASECSRSTICSRIGRLTDWKAQHICSHIGMLPHRPHVICIIIHAAALIQDQSRVGRLAGRGIPAFHAARGLRVPIQPLLVFLRLSLLLFVLCLALVPSVLHISVCSRIGHLCEDTCSHVGMPAHDKPNSSIITSHASQQQRFASVFSRMIILPHISVSHISQPHRFAR